MCPKYFLKTAGKPNNYLFYLPDFLRFCDNISHKLLRPSQVLENFRKFWHGPLCRIKSGPSPPNQSCSMLKEWQHRSSCQQIVSDTCKQHWQWGKGDWSQNLCEVLHYLRIQFFQAINHDCFNFEVPESRS